MTLTTTTLDTPVGALRLVASETGLRSVSFPGQARAEGADDGDSAVLAEAARQLREYFAGDRTAFTIPLDLVGTPFQLDAWRQLAEIPYGETVSYAEQAAAIGRPRAVRAIGDGQRQQPRSDRAAVPPRDRLRRLTDGLRRGSCTSSAPCWSTRPA